MSPDEHLSHILFQLGENRSAYFQAIVPPIIQSSNFAFPDIASFRAAFCSELEHHVYTRGNNPTVEILRSKVAALESTEDALIFASGAAAIAAAIISNVSAGDHVVCQQNPYSWTGTLLRNFLTRFGVEHTFVDGTDMRHIIQAHKPNTRVLMLESPNTLTYEIQDLEAASQWAQQHNIVTIIDNSYCSPIFQQPARFGIDIVVHSGTKYLNGHSDVMVGVVCASKTMIARIFQSEYMTLGGVISPHDAALVLRGLRTLPLRMRQSDESARYIIDKLINHPLVEQIYYPFLPDNPQYELAKRQMSGCGGLFSVKFKIADKEAMIDFVERVKRFLMAVSWGGYESLMLPSIGFYDIPGRSNPSLPFNFVRFYIGLEDPQWLWEDLEQALSATTI